jgi:hypothetical protein
MDCECLALAQAQTLRSAFRRTARPSLNLPLILGVILSVWRIICLSGNGWTVCTQRCNALFAGTP